MVSAKQWGFVLKGGRKIFRGGRKAASGIKRAVTGGKAALELPDMANADTIRMGKNLKGEFSQSTKHGAAIKDALAPAFNRFREGFYRVKSMDPKKQRGIAKLSIGAAGGSVFGVQATKAEQKHIDIKRAAKGEAPTSKGLKRVELGLGAIGGGIFGARAAVHSDKLYRMGKATARGLKVGNPDAIARTATMALGAASGGIVSHAVVSKQHEKKGFKNKAEIAFMTGAGALAGAVGGIKTYSAVRYGGLVVGKEARAAAKGNIGSIARVGSIAAATALGAKYSFPKKKVQLPETTKSGKARRAVLVAHGGVLGAGAAGGVLQAVDVVGQMHARYGEQMKAEYERRHGKPFPSPTASFKAGAQKFKRGFSSFMARKFPKKPKALIGMHGGQ